MISVLNCSRGKILESGEWCKYLYEMINLQAQDVVINKICKIINLRECIQLRGIENDKLYT